MLLAPTWQDIVLRVADLAEGELRRTVEASDHRIVR